MADRFWVGGSDTWNTTAGTKWATTSGGAGGAAIPTTSDDVFFDASSGIGTVIVSVGNACQHLNFTGYAGTIDLFSNAQVSGSLTLASAMTLSGSGNWNLRGSGGADTITTNGKTISNAIVIQNSSSYTLTDGINVDYLTLSTGSLDTGNFNITVIGITCTGTNTLTLGSSTVTISGGNDDISDVLTVSAGTTINADTSTIKLMGALTEEVTIALAGKTYNNFWNATTGNFATIISGSNTFNEFRVNSGRTVEFVAGTTQTVTNFNAVGDGDNLIILKSDTAASQFNLSKSSGTVDAYYLDLSDSNATGGAVWNAHQSIDTSNNDGWLFPNPLSENTGFILNGTHIKRPHSINEERQSVTALKRMMSGKIGRDLFAGDKRFWKLGYQNVTLDDYTEIYDIYTAYLSSETPVTWQIESSNYEVEQTEVHIDLNVREFSVPGSSYISEFELVLVEA